MTDQSFSFVFDQDVGTVVRALRTKWDTGLPPVKGQAWASVIKLLQCVLMGLGALGFGIGLEYLISGELALSLWTIALGVVLLYIAVFGVIFVTMPVMARRALATRANQGQVHMTLDATGVQTRMDNFQSHIAWAGVEAMTRTKQSFVFWVGGNRPSLPFTAFEGPAQIEAVDKAVKHWMEASR